MATRMQQRRGTAQQWTTANPVLAAGEIGFETDNNRFKIGDGVTAWGSLDYFANSAALSAILDGAPDLLNTLGELATAIGEDPEFFTTVADDLALKAPLASPALTGVPTAPTAAGTTNTTQIATTEFVQSKIASVIGNAPELLNTLEELSAALGDDESFAADIANSLSLKASLINLSDHNSTTTNVHGIGDTSLLVTIENLEDSITAAINTHNTDETNVHGIADTSLLATTADVTAAGTAASTALGLHADATTSVHGIADTSLLVTQAELEDALDTATVDQSTLAGVGIDWNAVNGQFDIAATIATTAYADQAALDAATAAADAAETDAITAAGTAADTKIATAVAALTKSSVGLSNVDNTSDANKPVSTATQTALDAKASLSGATFTGNVEMDGNLVVDGDFTVNGTNFSASATSITIEDNLVQLAHQNAANTVDLGLVVGYNDGAAKHSGIVRDVSADKWKLFKGVTSEPSTTVDFTQGSLDALQVAGLEATTLTVSTGVAFSDGTQTREGTPSRTPIVPKTGAYTLSALTHRDSLIEVSHTGGTAVKITVPADATLNYPIGTSIDILQTNTGEVTVEGAATVTVNATPGLTLRTRWSSATLFKRAANTWVLYGDLK